MSFFKKYWGTLRRQRFLHFLNNLFHYHVLKKNKNLYERFGIRKSIVSSLSHRDISSPSQERPWLDKPDAKEKLSGNKKFSEFSPAIQNSIASWIDKGYLILPGFVAPEVCDKINEELEKAIEEKKAEADYTNSRVMNFFRYSDTTKNLVSDKKLTTILDFILGKKTAMFQTINFTHGSQQHTHSDTIHMTTEPLGYLLAIWVALEDITQECGPLHYYPGSHKFPYILSEDFEHDNSFFSVGVNYYEYYERKIAELVKEKNLQKEIFLAKKGDLLIWHANILHGGEKRINPQSTRKSLVAHYFCEGDVINYHEITQRPAILKH